MPKNETAPYELRPLNGSDCNWVVWLPNGTSAGTITMQYATEWNSSTPFHTEPGGVRRRYGHDSKEAAVLAVLEGLKEYTQQQLDQANAAIESLKK